MYVTAEVVRTKEYGDRYVGPCDSEGCRNPAKLQIQVMMNDICLLGYVCDEHMVELGEVQESALA